MSTQNKSMQGENSTFWKLTEKYGIVIPVIQRDYAQGRRADNVRQVRERFVESLYYSLQYSKPAILDFIYGTLETPASLTVNYKETTGYLEFVPLDGQQRLTTLFLLYWFLSLWNENDFSDFKSHMIYADSCRFTYRTRSSSNDFCWRLVTSSDAGSIIKNISNRVENPVYTAVVNEGWFHDSWINDPTVQGMLVMLDTLACLLPKADRKETAHDFYKKLTRHDMVSFNLLYLNRSNSDNKDATLTTEDRFSDDLYIKMNSRGKPLSDFEIFKCRFESYLRDYKDFDVNDFERKIDCEWADMFWKIRNDVPHKNAQFIVRSNTDQMMMNLINAALATTYSLDENASEDTMDILFRTAAARNKKLDMHLTFYRYTELGVLKEKSNADATCLDRNSKYGQDIKDTFTFVSDFILSPGRYRLNQSLPDVKTCIYKILFDNVDGDRSFYGPVSYADRLYFFALSRFNTIYAGDSFVKDLETWVHFVRNLIESAEINQVRDMQKFLKVLDGILAVFAKNGSCNIISYLNSVQEYPDWSPVPGTQVREEVLKAKLISRDNRWLGEIQKADHFILWPGRSGYLLYFAGLAQMKDGELDTMSTQDHTSKLALYKEYLDKMEKLLLAVKDSSQHLLERFLLSRGNYMRRERKGYGCTIYSMMNSSFEGRSYSWRQMLQYNGIPGNRGELPEYHVGVDMLKLALDAISVQNFNDVSTLQQAIAKTIDTPSQPIELWRKQMLEEPRLWNMSCEHFFWLGDSGNAWMPRKRNFNSSHYNVTSYRLFLKVQDKFGSGSVKLRYWSDDWGYIYLNFRQAGSEKYCYTFKIQWLDIQNWKISIVTENFQFAPRPVDGTDLRFLGFAFDSDFVSEVIGSGGKIIPAEEDLLPDQVMEYQKKICDLPGLELNW